MITALGLVRHLLSVMILAIIISIVVIMVEAGTIVHYEDLHPTLKMLALEFLILVGVTLSGQGLDFHIPKAYIYFAMDFSMGVEMLNIRLRSRSKKTSFPPGS